MVRRRKPTNDEGEGAGDDSKEEDESEQIGKRRSGRRRHIEDDDEEFSPPTEKHGDDDEDEDDDESESHQADEDEHEEEYHGRYPRRRRAEVTTFAEEQARELARRRARRRIHDTDDDDDEEDAHDDDDDDGQRRSRRGESIQVSYTRQIPQEHVTLITGEVITAREYRARLRRGEDVRTLRPGEKVGDVNAHAGDAASSSSIAGGGGGTEWHVGVRRSQRSRHQVVPFMPSSSNHTVEVIDDSDEEKHHHASSAAASSARDYSRNASSSRHKASSSRSRRAGGSRRYDYSHHPQSYGPFSSSSSSSSSSVSSDSSSSGHRHSHHRHRRHGRRRDRDRSIQPLHLQIQHAMRKLESEAARAGAAAASGEVPLPVGTAALPGHGSGSGKMKRGDQLADIDPIEVDSSVDWSSVGGLDTHVRALKEMVEMPLLYPELFARFRMQPPKGVLFFGPPGTGKTLVARALANACSRGDQKVSFFMRKGADCLSKWVGEAERQLRLLFEQARKMQPSIIFFDEIDGLAPVRSSRQDQIHSSIVSTLLALMDGLDSRGQVIVVGATNRPDSIDPALRRPGRFDRELMFGLPGKDARRQILAIHTRSWQPPIPATFLDIIAEKCVGYCGADLKALCTEATLHAIRRQFPTIYSSSEKLHIDVDSIRLKQVDFERAMRDLTPSAQRSSSVFARKLPHHLRPLLEPQLMEIHDRVRSIFPLGARSRSAQANQGMNNQDHASGLSHASRAMDDEYADDDDDDDDDEKMVDVTDLASSSATAAVFSPPPSPDAVATPASASSPPTVTDPLLSLAPRRPPLLPFRPRLLLNGKSASMGQSHLAPALLHLLEEYPTISLDLASVLGDALSKNPEEACARMVGEARKMAPSILYIPHIDLWWNTATETLQHTLLTLINDMPSDAPVLIFATADCEQDDLPPPLQSIFPMDGTQCIGSNGLSTCPSPASLSALCITIYRPSRDQIASFLAPLLSELRRPMPRLRPRHDTTQSASSLPQAPVSVSVAPKPTNPAASVSTLTPEAEVDAESSLTSTQLSAKIAHENELIRLMRMNLRGILNQLIRDFPTFTYRPSPKACPDFNEVVATPISLSEMLDLLNGGDDTYDCPSKVLRHIDLLVCNTKEYAAHLAAQYAELTDGAMDDHAVSEEDLRFLDNQSRDWKMLVNEVCHLQDVALSLVAQQDAILRRSVEDIAKRRAVRRSRETQGEAQDKKQQQQTHQPMRSTSTTSGIRTRRQAAVSSAHDDAAHKHDGNGGDHEAEGSGTGADEATEGVAAAAATPAVVTVSNGEASSSTVASSDQSATSENTQSVTAVGMEIDDEDGDVDKKSAKTKTSTAEDSTNIGADEHQEASTSTNSSSSIQPLAESTNTERTSACSGSNDTAASTVQPSAEHDHSSTNGTNAVTDRDPAASLPNAQSPESTAHAATDADADAAASSTSSATSSSSSSSSSPPPQSAAVSIPLILDVDSLRSLHAEWIDALMPYNRCCTIDEAEHAASAISRVCAEAQRTPNRQAAIEKLTHMAKQWKCTVTVRRQNQR